MPNIVSSSAVVASPFVPTCPESGLWTRMRKVPDGGFCVPRYSTLLARAVNVASDLSLRRQIENQLLFHLTLGNSERNPR